MKTNRAMIGAVSVAVLSCPLFASCSLMGFGVGALIDSGTSPTTIYDSVKVSALRPGRKVTLTTSGGQSVTGKCDGWIEKVDSVYLLRYEQAVDKRLVPALESHVTVVASDAQKFDGILLGFQVNTQQRNLRDRQPKPVDPWQVCLRTNGTVAETCLTLQNVNAIHVPDGRVFPSEALSTRLAVGSVPTRSAIRLREWSRAFPITQAAVDTVWAPSDTLVVPIWEVERVVLWNGRNSKWRLSGIGLGLDLFFIVAAAISGGLEMQ